MRQNSSVFFLWFLLAASILMTGCSDKNPLNRQAVAGTVKLGGTALDTGTIEFHPTGSTGTMSGAVITGGSYQIAEDRGLPPGEYLVRISAADGDAELEEMPGESSKLSAEKIPPDFNVDSQVKVQVEAGKANAFDFDIPATADQQK